MRETLRKSPDLPVKPKPARELVSRLHGAHPLHINENQGASRRPETISAVANGIPQRKIFEERQQNNERQRQRHPRRRAPQHDPHHKGNQHRRRRHARPSHEPESFNAASKVNSRLLKVERKSEAEGRVWSAAALPLE